MQPSAWGVIFLMLGLIALYLILVNSGGSTSLLSGLQSLSTNETKTLQGRG